MTAMAELSATSPAVWWISGFITLLLIGIEMTPVLVKLMSPVGPYETAVEGIHTVAANEVALKCQTQMQIAEHHYGRILDAERRADDELHSVHVGLSEEQLQHKADQWKQAKAAGRGGTMEELLSSIRAEILTNRGTG
jgi:hypothetical protein